MYLFMHLLNYAIISIYTYLINIEEKKALVNGLNLFRLLIINIFLLD